MTNDTDIEITGRERVISGLFVDYWTTKRDADGNDHKALATAHRGASIVLSPAEESRLDELGMLAPIGHTAEDVTAAHARTREAMVAQNMREAQDRDFG